MRGGSSWCVWALTANWGFDKLYSLTSSHGPQARDFIGEDLHDGSQPGDIGVEFCVVLLKTLVGRLQSTQAVTVSFGLGLGLTAGQGANSIRHIGVSVVDQGGCHADLAGYSADADLLLVAVQIL
jgi:hypothetical protein